MTDIIKSFENDYNSMGVVQRNDLMTVNNEVVNGYLPNLVTDMTDPSALKDGQSTHQQTIVNGYLQSANFVTGQSGWNLDSSGNIEANNGTFRGNITGSSGVFSGSLSAVTGTFIGDISGASGTFSKTLYVGGMNIIIDGVNKRIVLNDGITNRVVIGNV